MQFSVRSLTPGYIIITPDSIIFFLLLKAHSMWNHISSVFRLNESMIEDLRVSSFHYMTIILNYCYTANDSNVYYKTCITDCESIARVIIIHLHAHSLGYQPRTAY